ncbi:MAG: thiol reductase thioredoxin [Bacteroidales bacterium]|nr:thiol reductase thioredoxin [Bacteroidales bacterium]
MKTLHTIALAAISAVLFISSCGNAGARNTEDERQAKESKPVIELNARDFNRLVYDMTKDEVEYLGTLPAIVDFTATWCGPCQRIAPILEELASEYDGQIVIYKVDIDKERELAEAFSVSSIPAILYIPVDGEPLMTIGSRGKDKFRKEIDTILLPSEE